MRRWLDWAWSQVWRLEVRQGGDDVPLARRRSLASIEDRELLSRIEKLATAGLSLGDACRCPGDLTLVLFDTRNAMIGSVTLHPGRLSWQRERFQNVLTSSDSVALRLLLSRIGINGASRRVLDQLISALGLHEDGVQFRQAGDAKVMVARRVPPALIENLWRWSGEEAANLDQELVVRLLGDLIRMEVDLSCVIRQLMAWLGSATWPAEAIAGDGQLARRMLGELDPVLIEQILPELSDSFEVMGAVAWAAFHGDDAAIMNAIGPAVMRLLCRP